VSERSEEGPPPLKTKRISSARETDRHFQRETSKLEQIDYRWHIIKRPIVTVGGELTLQTLDLIWDEELGFYEAPFQVKANCGMLMIDDFGRQRVHPKDLLNRWIYPLEKQVDFLTLHTGKKFAIPFIQLLVFATNLDPASLVDEAFLRRIKYRIKIEPPNESQFREIFKMVCAQKRVPYNESVINYLIERYYTSMGREFRACHPRDIIELIIDNARYRSSAPVLTPEVLDAVCRDFFVDL
jgi:hypothetical protein